jgi:hypothetical protein
MSILVRINLGRTRRSHHRSSKGLLKRWLINKPAAFGVLADGFHLNFLNDCDNTVPLLSATTEHGSSP